MFLKFVLVSIAATTLIGQSATQPAPATAPKPQPLSPAVVEVALRSERPQYPINSPIPMEFIVRNITAEPVTLEVPLGALDGKLQAGIPYSGMGLPIEHVFSGNSFRALALAIEGDPYLGDRVTRPPSRTIPSLVLAPFAQIGIRFDVTRYYPTLQREGRYELRWKPYGGIVQSPPLVVDVKPFKQVLIDTDAGRMTMRLLYDKAPHTVDSFLELVGMRFYDGTTFFRVDPAIAIQAGCPRGDGSSIRPDGQMIAPEFNDTPFEFGTVGLSLSKTGEGQWDPATGSCQFFIAMARLSQIDRKFTAFGRIEGPESLRVLRKIAEMSPKGDGSRGRPVGIRAMTLQDAPTPPAVSSHH